MSDTLEQEQELAGDKGADTHRDDDGAPEHEDERGISTPSGTKGHGPLAELARQERPDIEVEGDDGYDSRAAVAMGNGTEEDWERTTEWLLQDTAEVVTLTLWLKVGDPKDPAIPWIIKAIPTDVIRSAEREARAGNRAARRNAGQAQQYDDLKANLRVMVEGTVTPDLPDLASRQGLRDPATLLQRRFAYKPGIVAQVASQIMAISGFDEEDVQAAGN